MKRGRHKTGEPGTERYAKPGPMSQGTVEDVHLRLPVEVNKYIHSVTDNRTAWLVEAAREKMDREIQRGQEHK